ncbi:unnamed protein product [Miscanthus lutarioriparius]|uniref:Uncharacterized protein n=1 Tax=Miscanthus lutarioriparius TaxID=422564 RepID=A0A811MAC9_9POAL|nr:unnamed protein product [Miscanthus lutarioriparius]
MSKSPRALQELMTAVDAGHVADVNVDSASSDSSKLLGPRRRPTPTYNGHGGGVRKSAPAVAVVEASTDASFEFSAVVSYSSASPASMVFSDGQLRAHQFPAVRSAASAGSSQATSPVRSSSVGSSCSSTKQQQAGVTGSKKRVSFAAEGADKAGGGQGKKSGGLLGCMGSVCGPSSRNEAVEPVARNDNRKVVAF